MTAKIIDGELIADGIKDQLLLDIKEFTATWKQPKLVAIQVGESPASTIYTNMQKKACESVGIEYELQTWPHEIGQEYLVAQIEQHNRNTDVDGIILQMPLPSDIDVQQVRSAIDPRKDVEGLHPENLGLLFYGRAMTAPCTAQSAIKLLKGAVGGTRELAGMETVIIGHSELFGKPAAIMLLQSFNFAPTVTICHAATRDLAAHTRNADIIMVATGVRQLRWLGYRQQKLDNRFVSLPDLSPLVKTDMIKDGAIIIDVAINRIPKDFDDDGQPIRNDQDKIVMKTVGDVDFEGALDKAAAITPVPGGVGAVTTAMLLRNTLTCATIVKKDAEREK